MPEPARVEGQEEPIAESLARWAASFEPTPTDLALAQTALVDTVAVAVAAHSNALSPLADGLHEAGRWAFLAHLLDYDDLHLGSTTHISAVCIPAALSAGGGARAYLAGAGVMARLGEWLGWGHYSAGWHATCTAGAPGAAAAAAVAVGLDAAGIATAMALAIPAAGGVQNAFGTAAKPLQVGFAVDAGRRAAALAAAGATADLWALDQWLGLVGGSAGSVVEKPAVPGGLAVKAFPCCYALQRPIEAALTARAGHRLRAGDVAGVKVVAPAGALQPLIHHRPTTGLEGKFSLEYAVAAAVLDDHPGLGSFSDAGVARPDAQDLIGRVRTEVGPGGDGLVSGAAEVEIALTRGGVLSATVAVPAGAPGRALPARDRHAKVADCAGPDAERVGSLLWDTAAEELRSLLR
jgi:2-methylcitrate dehydratase PrpD